jgi:DNA polymerase-3 subunit epsilon
VEPDVVTFLVGCDEVIIHNAGFDCRFLDRQMAGGFSQHYRITDSLKVARQKHPGSKASLDALAKRYEVQGRDGEFHGALLDVHILAEVWLRMTSGQEAFELPQAPARVIESAGPWVGGAPDRIQRTVFLANEQELAAHAEFCRLNNIPVF